MAYPPTARSVTTSGIRLRSRRVRNIADVRQPKSLSFRSWRYLVLLFVQCGPANAEDTGSLIHRRGLFQDAPDMFVFQCFQGYGHSDLQTVFGRLRYRMA